MQHWLTDLSKTIDVSEFDGEITLLQAKFWPAWEAPKFTNLFSYELAGETYNAKVVMGREYTFEVLAEQISDVLNVGDMQVVLMKHENGRVTWRVFQSHASKQNPTRPYNIKLSSDILKLLKLDGINQPNKFGTMIGNPIDKDSIKFAFSNARMLFLDCREIDWTYVDGREAKTLLVVPVAVGLDESITADLQNPAVVKYHNNYSKELTFRVHDEHGNDLPLKRALLRFK